MKTITYSKNCTESRIFFLFRLSFALIGRFFTVYIHSRLLNNLLGSQAAFRRTLRVTGGYGKAWTSSLKMVTGRVLTISKWFKSRNFILIFITKRQSKTVTTITAYSESLALIFRTLKKYSSRDTIPLVISQHTHKMSHKINSIHTQTYTLIWTLHWRNTNLLYVVYD